MTFRAKSPSTILLAAAFSIALATGMQSALAQQTSLSPGINDSYRNPDIQQRVEQFEGESREIFQKRAEIVEVCGLEPGLDVADIGAGTGLFTRPFAEKVGPEGTVYAVDISDKFIDHILASCKERDLKNVRGIVCSQESTELPPGSVDLAFICDTYHHFEFPVKTMSSVHKALRPEGRLIVIDFKKIKGVTPERMMEHVRGDQEMFTKEITEAGFELVDTVDIMKGQYVLRFRKKTPPSN